MQQQADEIAAQKREIANSVIETWNTYKDKAHSWRNAAQADRLFRLGHQWTSAQEDALKARGQAPVVVNRIQPAVETAKALLTANRPAFRVSGREDSDTKVAKVMDELLAYIWDSSDGIRHMRAIIDDYYVTGLGVALAYQDPTADEGRGDVKFVALDPLDVYVDPNSRDRMFDDAASIIVSRIFTKEQASRMFPRYQDAVANAAGTPDNNWAMPNAQNSSIEVFFPSDVGEMSGSEYIRGYEEYKKVYERMARIYEKFSGREYTLTEQELREYMGKTVLLYRGNVIWDQEEIANVRRQIDGFMQTKDRQRQILFEDFEVQKDEMGVSLQESEMQINQAVQQGQISEARAGHELEKMRIQFQRQMEQMELQLNQQLQQMEQAGMGQEVTNADMVQQGYIEMVPVTVTRVQLTAVIGDKLMYQRILPVDQYPIVPFVNNHTHTPYPTSDVRMVRPLQEYINKVRSLIVAHASTSTSNKVLVPAGSVDMAKLEEQWARPGAFIEINMELGTPIVVPPAPLPNELYKNEADAKNDIDHQLGLYELMMGNSQAAPQTNKATLNIDEFGQRKIRSKLQDIESSIKRLGQVLIPLAQQLYTTEKIVRVVQPNNVTNEVTINKRLIDDKSGQIRVINDISVGKFDCAVLSGSSLPVNRFAQFEIHLEAYKLGLIDNIEALKKSDIYDAEGVLTRIDEREKLQAALEQAQEQIKQLSGDMQTKDREIQSLRNKVEVEKFKTGLNAVETQSKAAATLFDERLNDILGTVRQEIRDAVKDKKQKKESKK